MRPLPLNFSACLIANRIITLQTLRRQVFFDIDIKFNKKRAKVRDVFKHSMASPVVVRDGAERQWADKGARRMLACFSSLPVIVNKLRRVPIPREDFHVHCATIGKRDAP